MGYVFDDVTGRIAAIFLTTTPTPPSGFTFTTDAIANEDIIDSKRDIGGGVLKKRDGLRVVGSANIPLNGVADIVIQKFDGTTLFDLTDAADDDPVGFAIDSDKAFLNKKDSELTNGADSVRVAAPAAAETTRLFAFSEELQLLDTEVVFV
jgi:hypothetical protein